MVIRQYGTFLHRTVRKCQVNDQLTYVALSFPIVCESPIITYFQSILANHCFLQGGIPLHMAHQVPLTAVGVDVSRDDSSAVPNDGMPDHQLCLSLSRLRASLIVNIDNPSYLLHSPVDISHNYIVVSFPCEIRLLLSRQATALSYRRTSFFFFSLFPKPKGSSTYDLYL